MQFEPASYRRGGSIDFGRRSIDGRGSLVSPNLLSYDQIISALMNLDTGRMALDPWAYEEVFNSLWSAPAQLLSTA